MKKCIFCGAEIPDNACFCTKCGKKLDTSGENNNPITDAAAAFIKVQSDDNFEKLYRLSYKKLYSYVLMQTKDRNITEDVLQSGYLICYNKASQISDPDGFMAWMRTVCIREFITLKNKQRDFILLNDDSDDSDSAGPFDNFEDESIQLPENAVEDMNLKQLLENDIDLLPEAQKLAVTFFYFDEKTIKEIAEIMMVPENTVKTYLSRARKKLNASVGAYADRNGLKLVPFAIFPFMALLFSEKAAACETDSASLEQMPDSVRHNMRKKEIPASDKGSIVKTVFSAVSKKTAVRLTAGFAITALAGSTIIATLSQKHNTNANADSAAYTSVIVNASVSNAEGTPYDDDVYFSNAEEKASDADMSAPAVTLTGVSSNTTPEGGWGEIPVTEYVDDVLGVHFFIPSGYAVSMRKTQNWETTGVSVFLSGEGMDNEYLFTTGAETKEGWSAGESGEMSREFITFLSSSNMQYALYFPSGYEEDISPSMADFLSMYKEKIVASAFVPKGTKPPYYGFSVADDKATTTDSDIYEGSGAPQWIIRAPDGKMGFDIGDNLAMEGTDPLIVPAGNYTLHGMFGMGNVMIYGKNGITVASYHFDSDHADDMTVTLSDGDSVNMDADDGQCIAIALEPQ